MKLNEIATITMGQSPDSASYNIVREGIPFFQGNADFGKVHPNVRVWCSSPKKYAHKDDILISVRAPIGALNVADQECCIGRGLAAIQVVSLKCLKDYIFYFLSSRVPELNAKGTGSTFKAISKGILENIEIPLISLEEQREIVKNLEDIDQAIEMCNLLTEKTEDLVKSRFIELFGDPVTNPKGWKTSLVRDTSELISDGPFGSNLKTSHYVAEGIRVIRLGNIGSGKFLDEDKAYISEEHYATLKKYTCHAGEIVIGTLGEPNLRACLIPDDIAVSINKSDCVHFIPKTELLNNIYACAYLNTEGALQLAQRSLHGQTRSRIAMSQVAALPIMLPPLALQNEFAAFVEQADKSKLVIQELLKKHELLKEALLQKYFG